VERLPSAVVELAKLILSKLILFALVSVDFDTKLHMGFVPR